MKKKNRWTRVIVLSVVFVIAIIVSSMITNQGNDHLAVDMPAATLPRVKFILDGLEVNTLVGYKDEMDLTAMRDTITPADEDVIQLSLERNNNTIDDVSYEIYSSNGKELLAKGTGKESNGIIPIPLNGLLSETDEAILKVTLLVEDQELRYYTRIISSEELMATKCLKFAQQLHSNTFGDKASKLTPYLESNEKGDNYTYQTINIHSDAPHVMWGNLNPEVISAPEWDIKECNYSYTSILARYQVRCVDEEGAADVYNIREFFRVRSVQGQLYLLDYQRSMNEVFNGIADVLTETGISLGMAPLDIPYMTNDSGTIISFVQERDLWTYNQDADELSLVFSFSNTEGNDIRNWYDQHNIHILHVDENGSTTFAVYGYMNRGRHEGRVGVNVFYFNIETNALEEKAFIPSSKSFAIAEDELGRMVYYSHQENRLFVLTGGVLYEVNLAANTQQKLAEGLQPDQYVTSENGQLLAYQVEGSLLESRGITVLNLATDEKTSITCEKDEAILPLGFINDDFVYGIVRESDQGKTVAGNPLLPMYQLEIRDNTNKVVKTYHQEGIYLTDVVVENNMVTMNRVTKNGDTYIGTTQDYITSNEEHLQSNITLDSFISESKGRVMRFVFAEGISDKSPKVLKPKQVALENVLTLTLNSDMGGEKFYVYGTGELAGIYDTAAYAIQRAEALSGVVISSDQHYIWEKGNRDLVYDTGVAAFLMEEGQTLKACKEFMSQYDAQEVDLTGCTVEQVLYIINKGLPAIVVLNETEGLLITAYNSELVTYVDGKSEERVTVDYATLNQMAAAAGYTFIGYVQ